MASRRRRAALLAFALCFSGSVTFNVLVLAPRPWSPAFLIVLYTRPPNVIGAGPKSDPCFAVLPEGRRCCSSPTWPRAGAAAGPARVTRQSTPPARPGCRRSTARKRDRAGTPCGACQAVIARRVRGPNCPSAGPGLNPRVARVRWICRSVGSSSPSATSVAGASAKIDHLQLKFLGSRCRRHAGRVEDLARRAAGALALVERPLTCGWSRLRLAPGPHGHRLRGDTPALLGRRGV